MSAFTMDQFRTTFLCGILEAVYAYSLLLAAGPLRLLVFLLFWTMRSMMLYYLRRPEAVTGS